MYLRLTSCLGFVPATVTLWTRSEKMSSRSSVAAACVVCVVIVSACVEACTISRNAYDDDFYREMAKGKRHKRDLSTNCDPDSAVPPTRVNTTQRLFDLRAVMLQHNLSAYYVPLDDEGRRTWISGFSGSNGDAIVTLDAASCWTDGRYFLQAADQLDCNWMLMRMGVEGVPAYTEWMRGAANLTAGDRVGCDPTLMGAQTWLDMSQELLKSDLHLVSIDDNLIDLVWTEGRPPFQAKDLHVHPMEFAGKEWPDKIADLRGALVTSGHTAIVVSELDEIAWLFNLRGEGNTTSSGLMKSPLFHSLAVVSSTEVLIWLPADKLTEAVLDHLQRGNCAATSTCVQIGDYEEAIAGLRAWAAALSAPQDILVSKVSTFLGGASFAVYGAIPEEYVRLGDSPVLAAKAIKNEVEVAGMIAAHLRDAYALCDFLSELEEEISLGNEWTEISAASRLSTLRRLQPNSRGDSFTTISAAGSNAAIIHYGPRPETDAKINNSAIYLLDSGGQYLDGTIDVTRTMFYGTPSSEIVKMYTLVLMGAIDLARVVAPKDTRDTGIDFATRQHLFRKGLDYRHGTGHGIGAYMSVHEAPISVRMYSSGSVGPGVLKENMFFSDEPGFYKDGAYGIRLETILRVVKKDLEDVGFGEFIGFEAVTLVPFEPKLIDFSLMSPEQIEWYNGYNAKIVSEVASHFVEMGNDRAARWVLDKTQFVDPAVSNSVQKWKIPKKH